MQRLFDRAQAFEKERRFDEAIDAYVAVVRETPAEALPYERLFDIHLHLRDMDAAWCTASMLVVLDTIGDDAREVFEDYTPRRLPVPGRLDAADWELLRDSAEDTPPAQPAHLRSLLEAPPIEATPAFDSSALRWAADALGAPSAAIAISDPPIVPRSSLDATHRMFMLRERLFFAGREATAYLGPYYELRRCSLRDITRALGANVQGDVAAWERAITNTRARAGLLVCGEPVLAHQLLVAEGAGEALLADLSAFAVSRAHHRLRKKIGWTVGANADTPDGRTG